jgi:hypothetical protein
VLRGERLLQGKHRLRGEHPLRVERLLRGETACGASRVRDASSGCAGASRRRGPALSAAEAVALRR